jgi:hypothetical protein
LVRRPDAEIQQELSRVDWLIGETARWDVTLVSRADARRLVQFYSQQADWLRAELTGVSSTQVEPRAPTRSMTPPALAVRPDEATAVEPEARRVDGSSPVGLPSSVEAPEPSEERRPAHDVAEASARASLEREAPAAAPAPNEEQRPAHDVAEAGVRASLEREAPAAAPAPKTPAEVVHPLEAREAPGPDVRLVEAASSWSRVWKPFLTDSVGWFVGGFLILAGTFWFVADAWAGMTSTVRAVTVFGLAAGWTLAFAAWAKFLFRREATTPAARMLERLAAAMAPLAPVAMGPAHDSPLLFWPLVLGWSAVTAFLTRAPAQRVDERGAGPLALAAGFTALVMGAAPFVAVAGVHATWLVALPVALAAWAFAAGPRAAEGATRFLVSAFAWVLLLFAVRVEVAIAQAGVTPNLTLLAPLVAAAVASVRWLAKPATRAADASSVLVVLVQVAMLVLSADVFSPAPAFVVTALLGAWTAWSLAKERVSLASARWLPIAYGFAYLAYQRIDQVVPAVVREWYARLKANLGYSSAPLPPSYGSVYAALFVVGVGVWAARRSRRADAMSRREGEVLLDTTAVASGFSSVLALLSLGSDARPALLATPVLAVVTLGLALVTGRFSLTIGGVVAATSAAVAFAIGLDASSWWGLMALALAAASVPALRPHRETLSVGALLLAGVGLLVSVLAVPSASAASTAALSAAAVMLVVRNLDDAEGLAVAWAAPFLAVAVASRWGLPGFGPVVLGLAAVLAGALQLRGGRWLSLKPMTVLSASSAVAWHALQLVPGTWVGVTMLLAAGAVALVSRTTRGAGKHVLEGLGFTLAVGTLLPAGCFPWPSPQVPQLVAAGLVALSSGLSLWQGRSVRWATLASLALGMTVVDSLDVTPERLPVAIVTALVATPALVPAVTMPLAGLLASLFIFLAVPNAALGTAFSVASLVVALLGLVDRVPRARRVCFNGASADWSAVATSAVLTVPALVFDPQVPWVPLTLGALLPQLWGLASTRRWLHALSLPMSAWGPSGAWSKACQRSSCCRPCWRWR